MGHPGWGMGVCTADVDGDGWEDLYVTGLGRNRLYHNNHDGTFTDVAEPPGVAGGGWSAGCGFADYDRDGDLDLFVSRYVKIDLDHLPEFGKGKTCAYRGIPVQCGPRGLPGESDFLFRNDGERSLHRGRARRRASPIPAATTAWASPGSTPTTTAGRICTWPTTRRPNFLYLNQKDGTFEEVGLPHGRGRERGRRRAGEHGRSGRRLRQQRTPRASS